MSVNRWIRLKYSGEKIDRNVKWVGESMNRQIRTQIIKQKKKQGRDEDLAPKLNPDIAFVNHVRQRLGMLIAIKQ